MQAYFCARKNKRNTQNQIAFELELEKNIHDLATRIFKKRYIPKPCIAFIINQPVTREIFAADFSDRVVHHLIYNAVYPKIDKQLINDAYSCRKEKGTLYGINSVKKMIRSCSLNYTTETYILKLDIKGYFMNMKHAIIYDKMNAFLTETENYNGLEISTIQYLLKKTIFNNVALHCKIKGKKSDWKNLPADKSLFTKQKGIGLPIGNLTSQIFGNIYLNQVDHYIKHTLKIKNYGRYVDDMIFIHNDKTYLKKIIPLIQQQLTELGLEIHPKKIYLQDYTKGVLFLGQYIKPYRTYISTRTKNNFYKAIKKVNALLLQSQRIEWDIIKEIQTQLNSYLGIMQHANAHRLIKKVLEGLSPLFYHFFGFTKELTKVYIKKKNWQWHYTQTYRFIK